MADEAQHGVRPLRAIAVLAAGAGVLLLPIPSLDPRAHGTLAILVAAAGLWMTEALPVAITALAIPVLALLLGIADARAAFAGFGDPIVFLFFGTFLLTGAAVHHGLTDRLARTVLSSDWVRAHPTNLLWALAWLGCGISAWVNNTATTAMLLPLALTAARFVRERPAALVIEPLVQGAAGMLVQPPGYLRKIRELCTRYNILMIADEVATGFGRTGTLFACEQEGVSPDIMATAKGITGGYLPLAATLATEEVYSAFLGEYREFRTFFHGHTYTGNPLACAAAIANIDLFKKERTLARLRPKVRLLAKELRRFEDLDHVGDVRQRGFMVGIELVKDRKTKEPYPLEDKMGSRVTLECRSRGLIIRSTRGDDG